MKTSNQLKAHVKNLANKYSLSPQILLAHFFIDRLLERISVSKYKKNFILKGGVLVSSWVGIDSRMTYDVDFSIMHTGFNKDFLINALSEIIKIDIGDATNFELLDLKEVAHGGIREGYAARFKVNMDKTRTVIHVDIGFDDQIIPEEVEYGYKLLLENRYIDITSYQLETVLAEKLECMLTRGILNTRMKDFYDCYLLFKLYTQKINYPTLLLALKNTTQLRNTQEVLSSAFKIINQIKSNAEMKSHWSAYENDFSYAKDLSFDAIMIQIEKLLKKVGIL